MRAEAAHNYLTRRRSGAVRSISTIQHLVNEHHLPSRPEGTLEPLPEGTPVGRGFIGLLMPGPAAAEDAVPIIEERLATGSTLADGRPFADIFPDPTVTAIPEDSLVLIDLPFGKTQRGILLRLLITRDLGFIAWG